MDKRIKKGDDVDFLVIKTGVDLYRSFFILLLGLSAICFVGFLFRNDNIIVIIGSLLFSIIQLFLSVFIDKLVYLLNLPTNHLLISKDEIIYKKRKKEIIFKTNETEYEFYSFFTDFESISQIKLISNGKEYFIPITKKQFKAMKQFLQK